MKENVSVVERLVLGSHEPTGVAGLPGGWSASD
jgi:hypothetical protein